jgi:hypothetical protein
MSESEHGEVLRASSPGPGQVEVGMTVVGVDGQVVGRVKDVRAADFVVDRPAAGDIILPYSIVMATPALGEKPQQRAEVLLNVTAARIEHRQQGGR